MTTRLTLICHVPTAATRAAAFPADEPIDEHGQQKLAALSGYRHKAGRCLTSPALAARQTAEALGMAATRDDMLRDCDYGRWAGRALEDVQASEPDAVARWLNDPAAAPHGGDSLIALAGRVGMWLTAQIALPGKAVAITHASVIRMAIAQAIGAEPTAFWRIDIAPLACVRLSASGPRWTLSYLGPLQTNSGAS